MSTHYSFNNRPKLTVHAGLFEGCDQWNIEYIPTTGEGHAGEMFSAGQEEGKEFYLHLALRQQRRFFNQKG